MKRSGEFTLKGLLIFMICFFAPVLPDTSFAGNAWMMEKNRDELLMLNAELLEQLDALNEDGEIILSGRVVIRDGQTILQLDTLKKYSSQDNTDNKSLDNSPQPQQKYKVFMREGTLNEIPVVKSSSE